MQQQQQQQQQQSRQQLSPAAGTFNLGPGTGGSMMDDGHGSPSTLSFQDPGMITDRSLRPGKRSLDAMNDSDDMDSAQIPRLGEPSPFPSEKKRTKLSTRYDRFYTEEEIQNMTMEERPFVWQQCYRQLLFVDRANQKDSENRRRETEEEMKAKMAQLLEENSIKWKGIMQERLADKDKLILNFDRRRLQAETALEKAQKDWNQDRKQLELLSEENSDLRKKLEKLESTLSIVNKISSKDGSGMLE